MPSKPRTIIPGIPHHIVQRGNRREVIFNDDDARKHFLSDLKSYASREKVKILAYCLMDNHTHLIAVPSTTFSFKKLFCPLHSSLSRRLSKLHGETGRNLQGRYYSSPMDDSYTINALRYVNMNPVRAGIVKRAEDYHWSSAAGHLNRRKDPIIDDVTEWQPHVIEAAAQLNSEIPDEEADLSLIRDRTLRNEPIGSQLFVRTIESLTGRKFRS